MGTLCTDNHTSTNGQGSCCVSPAVVLPMEDSMINCKHCCAWLWKALCAAAVSLFILPESPRWLVVNGHLDVALAVIHRVYTKSILPAGRTPARFACCTCQSMAFAAAALAYVHVLALLVGCCCFCTSLQQGMLACLAEYL